MSGWDHEALAVFNDGHFRFINPGPLHNPVHEFEIARANNLDIILKTTTAPDATSQAQDFPSGTTRINNETATLENIGGVTAQLRGIATKSQETQYGSGHSSLVETSKIYHASAEIRASADIAYVIDWVANLSSHSILWPDPVRTETVTHRTRTIGRDEYRITLPSEATRTSSGQASAKVCIDGVDIYICASRRDDDPDKKHGFIVYTGNPTEEFRRKIRRAVSFSLGTYVVYLGHTKFAQDWSMASFECLSAYSIDMRVFNLPVIFPAPLHDRFVGGVSNHELQRSVNSLFQCDERLNFADLSWAYWHALCSTVHIAPVHWGAAIEMLVRKHVEATAGRISDSVIGHRDTWRTLLAKLEVIVDADVTDPEDRQTVKQSIRNANRAGVRVLLDAVAADVGIVLGNDERRAWRRRNEAAHGMEMEAGTELTLIRDVKLLRGIFQRLLLAITGASGRYIDQATPGFPIQPLRVPVPDIAT